VIHAPNVSIVLKFVRLCEARKLDRIILAVAIFLLAGFITGRDDYALITLVVI